MVEEKPEKVEELMGMEGEEKRAHAKLIEDEVNAAFEEELGRDWLDAKPFHVRIAVQTARFVVVLVALYFFLVSLAIMSNGFSAVSGVRAGELFGGAVSPMVGLMVGILATVLVQSSSTTTAIVVVLVSNDLVSVVNAIPIIMGANIGTSVTNTIVSLGFVDDTDAYRRGFAGATVHDMFNYLNVAVLLPLELLVAAVRNDGGGGLLQTFAEFTDRGYKEGTTFEQGDNYKEANPIKLITVPLVDKIIQINKDVIEDAAKGFPNIPSNLNDCGVSFKFENKDAGVDGCLDGVTCDFCPDGIFNSTLYDAAESAFDNAELIDGGGLQELGDSTGGILALCLSLILLVLSLGVIVRTLTAVVKGSAKNLLIKTLNYNFMGGGYLSILVGCLITVVVQSSSITTSVLTPLVAVDTLTLENMFPFTLGANIGTTGTGLIAAAAAGKKDGFTIALVHLYFNIIGTLIWYPAPVMRNVPIKAARFLGEMASILKIFPLLYLFVTFVFYPLVFFGFSAGFQSDNDGAKAASGIILAGFLAVHGYLAFWYNKRDGKQKFVAFVNARREKLKRTKAEKEDKGAAIHQLGAAAEDAASL